MNRKEKESKAITSFYLEKENGEPLLPYVPGQFLSFYFESIGSDKQSCNRNYSLSGDPGIKDYYRISVKREDSITTPSGIISTHFHDNIHIGSKVQVGVPCGCFVLDETSPRNVVFISGGIGITPLISMLHRRVRTKPDCSTSIIQCVSSPDVHALGAEVDKFSNVNSHVFYGRNYEQSPKFYNTRVHSGILSQDLLKEVLSPNVEKNDYYICGPYGLLQTARNILQENGVPSDQIKYEHFGPMVE